MTLGARSNLRQRAAMMAGLAAIMIVALLIYQIWQSYRATVDAGNRDIQQLVQVLAASTDSTFQSAEIIVDHTIDQIQAQGFPRTLPDDIADRFNDLAESWAFVDSVALVGTDGVIKAATSRQSDGHLHLVTEKADISKSLVFQAHLQPGADEKLIFIGKPVAAPVSGLSVLAVSKSIRDANGKLQGVCLVTVTLDTFAHLFAGVLPVGYRAAGIYRNDSTLLLSTLPDAKLGEKHEDSHLFSRAVPAAPKGIYRAKMPADGSERLAAYQVSSRYPVVVVVNVFWDEMLAEWRATTTTLAGSALLGLLLIGALTWWLMRQIAAEQRIQYALAKSEHSLIESQRLSGISHFERDLRTGHESWGDNMYAVHGVDPDKFKPSWTSFLELVVPEDRISMITRWGQGDHVPSPSGNLECRIALPSGNERHMRYSWQEMSDGEPTPRRVFGIAQDVTAIRMAESTIRDDEERLRDIVECSSDYIWESDADGRLTMFTGADVAKFGPIVGVQPRIVIDDHFDEGDGRLMRQAFKERRRYRNLIAPLFDRNGQQHWLRSSGNPRFDSQGKFVGFRGAATDVTETLRQQGREEESRRAEALGRLASGLAHEINNLLQPITIYASFGSSHSELASDVRQYFTRIGRAADRATLIVKNVLAFARRSQPNREKLNPLEIVRETIDLISGTLTPGTTIGVADAVEELTVLVDRTGLAQVLTNLITNAVEAMPAGGRVVVGVSAVNLSGEAAKAASLAPGSYCRLSVEDNGPGISPDHMGKVFDPFFTTKPQGKGTGLGLSVVSGLVKSWGGGAAVESTPGERTCFFIHLPLVEQQLQAAQ